MIAFAASCVGAADLPVDLVRRVDAALPQGYRISVEFEQAVQLGTQADVRISGVHVGKVVSVGLDQPHRADARRAGDRSAVRAAAGGHASHPPPEDAARRDLRRALARFAARARCSRWCAAAARPGAGRRCSSTRSCRRSTRRRGARSRLDAGGRRSRSPPGDRTSTRRSPSCSRSPPTSSACWRCCSATAPPRARCSGRRRPGSRPRSADPDAAPGPHPQREHDVRRDRGPGRRAGRDGPGVPGVPGRRRGRRSIG